jgi:eukaryotic-like serine/threonine-protein kinase
MPERTIGGKYTLEREIGRGGMGSIWIAYDPQLRRRVALKLVHPDQTVGSQSRARFEREAMAVAQIQNPHVVQIHDYGIDEGAPYIVMELLSGEDLEARLSRCAKLPLAAVITIVTQAGRALSTAHAAGVIHRDLKPANIFLAQSDAEEVVKILDFGVATIDSGDVGDAAQVTRTGTLLGTPHYMSPEQARGSKLVDPRSDVWSLSVVSYRALTGELPFTGASLGDLIMRICTDPPPPPTDLASELPVEVDHFFERALAKDPAQRFQSAREMANAFAALANAGRKDKPRKILVIDDEPDMAILIQQRFREQIRRSRYEFIFAADGESGLSQLRRHGDIDIALTDINMPGMDGLTFLTHVGEVNPLVKVIMVSAYGDMLNIRQAMNRGAFDFLVKPIDFNDLEITLDKTLHHVHEVRKTIRSTEENSILRMFVNSGIIDRLLPSLRAQDAMAPEQVRATVAFIAVHGIEGVLDRMTPAAAVRTLNANFDVIAPEVNARRGVVDKFLGDALMAVFRGDDHAARALDACLAARAQLAAMAEITGEPSPYAHGVAIGVESGELISGSIGSKLLSRLDYTVLGAAVETAAFLQSIAAKDQILIGEALYQEVREVFGCERIEPPSGAPPPSAGYAVLAPRAAAASLANSKTLLIEEHLLEMDSTSELPPSDDDLLEKKQR